MSDVILAAFHGGLGDNLQFSTLPEEFHKQQGRDTYIWSQASFRNQEIYDLVWGHNPYVKGIKDGDWSAGDTPDRHRVIESDCISNWEALHGLKPTNKYPKIYYEPEKDKDIKDLFIVDFTTTTESDSKEDLIKSLEQIRNEYPDRKFVSVYFTDITPTKDLSDDIKFDGYIEVENIFRYCDLISSVYGYVSLHSGGTHLSSALKEYSPDLKSICILSKEWYNEHEVLDNHFLFDNIEYLKY